MNYKGTVAVAMSGGVDSSVSALLLQKAGYNVIGITGIMHENGESSADKAAEICSILGIQHYNLDLTKPFRNKIISYFEKSYKRGLTPNPCTVCNKVIKWGILKNYAHEVLNADFYATGHYARMVQNGNVYKLCRANDNNKDQIYMLFGLTQTDLEKTIFPLGDLKKEEVRNIAKSNNLPCAENKESQDVCFILPPDTTPKYLARKFGEKEGNIVDIKTGKIIGKHKGTYKYTIGQRKGIGIAASKPLYVASICSEKNEIGVGFLEDVSKFELEINNINWQQEEFKNNQFEALAKIRYNSEPQKAVIIPRSNYSTTVKFDKPQFAVTPGQAAVFYDLNNEYIIGGGWIINP